MQTRSVSSLIQNSAIDRSQITQPCLSRLGSHLGAFLHFVDSVAVLRLVALVLILKVLVRVPFVDHQRAFGLVIGSHCCFSAFVSLTIESISRCEIWKWSFSNWWRSCCASSCWDIIVLLFVVFELLACLLLLRCFELWEWDGACTFLRWVFNVFIVSSVVRGWKLVDATKTCFSVTTASPSRSYCVLKAQTSNFNIQLEVDILIGATGYFYYEFQLQNSWTKNCWRPFNT